MAEKVFVKDPAGWDFFTRSPAGPIGLNLRKRGNRLLDLGRKQAGKKTGALRASMFCNLTVDARGLRVEVGSHVKHARMHHDGTRPHVIRPRVASALRFKQNGRIRYAQRVFHPGTKPNRYLTGNLPIVVLD